MGQKYCNKCQTHKHTTEFHSDKSREDNLYPYCKLCKRGMHTREQKRRWYKTRYNSHKEEYKKYSSERYKNNREQIIEQTSNYYYENKDTVAEQRKIYRRSPAAKTKARSVAAHRRALKINATPVWFEKDKVHSLYEEAAKLKQQDGIQRHVDHIYPLVSDKVCSLHCYDNLQILTAVENFSKNNKLIEGEGPSADKKIHE